MISMNKIVKGLGVLVLALSISACGSKKKNEDAAALSGGGGGAIESSAMNFNVQGSDSGSISGLSSIRFEYDRSTLTAAARETLKANADWLKANSSVNLQVEGHCDSRGSTEYNLSLGERRAQTTKDHLVGLGIAESRLSIISYGEEKPLAMGDSEADMAKNRRANFVPLNALK